jgi:hypothetical protein
MARAITVYLYDITWAGYEVWIWLAVECNLAIICISIPVMRALVRKYAPCMSISTKSSKWPTSLALGSIFRRTSVTVECSDVEIAHSREEKARRHLYMDEEHGLESRWTERSQNSERDEMSYQGHQLGTSEVKYG